MRSVQEEIRGGREILEEVKEVGESPRVEVGGVHRGDGWDSEEVAIGSGAEV